MKHWRPFIRRVSDKMRRLHKRHTAGIKWHMLSEIIRYLLAQAFIIITSNNQRFVGSAGDNDRSSKCFCSNAVLWASFTWQMVKTRVIRLRGVDGRNDCDQIAFCSFHSFLVEVQTNAGYMRRMRNNKLGLGLRAPLVACNYYCYFCHHYWFLLLKKTARTTSA